jgi:hypothetical protein
LGRIAASQFDQTLFDVSLDLDLVGAWWLRAAAEGHVEALGDQLPPDAGDGPWAGAQGGDDLVIGALAAEGIVGEQEDAGVGEFAGRSLTPGDQLFQVSPFCCRQGHTILVHGNHPVLGVAIYLPPRTGYGAYLSNEDG